MRELTNVEFHELEALIDRTNVDSVLSALMEICYGKAEHLRMAWQDDKIATAWETVGKRIAAVDTKGL